MIEAQSHFVSRKSETVEIYIHLEFVQQRFSQNEDIVIIILSSKLGDKFKEVIKAESKEGSSSFPQLLELGLLKLEVLEITLQELNLLKL